MRVAMLLTGIAFAATSTRAQRGPGAVRPPLLPRFAVAFAVFVLVNSTGRMPKTLQDFGGDVSRWFLVAAITGIGMKTQPDKLASVGLETILPMLGETVFLALLQQVWR